MMKTNRIICVVAAIVLLAGLGQANAALLYSNYGTFKDITSGGDNNPVFNDWNWASDNFTLASAATVTGFFGNFLIDAAANPMTSIQYKLGSAANSGDIQGFQTATVTSTYNPLVNDAGGLLGLDSTFSINWPLLSAGTYWLTLEYGLTDAGQGAHAIYWSSTSGGTSANVVRGTSFWNPYPILDHGTATGNYGVAFSLDGDIVSGAVPEPAGLGLIGVALLALRKRRS